jgi:23S rRNA pseudouridine1911/1915/1917 synthase
MVPSVDVREATVPAELAGLRLDLALVRVFPDLTRARGQRLIEAGRVWVAGRKAKASVRIKGGEALRVEVPPPEPSGLLAQDIPLRVLYEDDDLAVLDKAAGMVVHPARGSPHSTLVNALLHRWGDGVTGPRLGLVHRLDRDTSGCIAVAKREVVLEGLQRLWKAHQVEKTYLAICHGALQRTGKLDTPYGRHPRLRTRFTSKGSGSRRAVTEWRVREQFGSSASLAEVRLHTGRTHQIRVHLAEHGHPLLADAVYGGARRESRLPPSNPARRAAAAIGRQALHAWCLRFEHPRTGRALELEAPIPSDFQAALDVLRR